MVHITEADIAYQKAHVRDDRSQDIVVSHAICIALAAIAILLRFVSRRLGKVAVGADDWMIVAAFVFVTGEVIGGLLCTSSQMKLQKLCADFNCDQAFTTTEASMPFCSQIRQPLQK